MKLLIGSLNGPVNDKLIYSLAKKFPGEFNAAREPVTNEEYKLYWISPDPPDENTDMQYMITTAFVDGYITAMENM